METINTILLSLLSLFVVIREVFYSKKRLELKNEVIQTKEAINKINDATVREKEAEISALKTSVQSMKNLSSQIQQLLEIYNPEKIKNYVKLSEDEAQMAAKQTIRNSVEEYTSEISRLKIENSKLKGQLDSKDENAQIESLDNLAMKGNYGAFTLIQQSHPSLWKDLIINLRLPPENRSEHIIYQTTNGKHSFGLHEVLVDFDQDGYLNLLVSRDPNRNTYMAELRYIKHEFWESLSWFIILEDERNDKAIKEEGDVF